MPDETTFYEDKAGEWRWHIRAANGKVVDASTEGFTRKEDAVRNYERAGHGDDTTGAAED